MLWISVIDDMTRDELIAGTLIITGVLVFMFGWHIAEFLYPGYSVSVDFISDLGATCRNGRCKIIEPSATIFNSTVSFLGLMLILSSYFLHKTYNKPYTTILIGITGLGAMGVGIFPETAGILHTVFSLITFAGAGLAILSFAIVMKGVIRLSSIVLGLITLTSLILFASGNHLGLGPGGMERLIVYPALMWALILGGYLCRES